MSVNENYLEGIVVSYQFHKFDVNDNDIYFFKVEDANSLDKLHKFFRKHWGHNVDFIYRKCLNTYVKVKHENIENFFNFQFEKGCKFKANLYLHLSEDGDGQTYYPKITLEDQNIIKYDAII